MFVIQKKFSFCTIIIALAFCTTEALAQVQIVPIAIYLDDKNKTGRIMVRNTSYQPIELTTELKFAYPATNKQGQVYLKKFDQAPADEPSAVDWIRVYPPHVILPPKEQQVIRFAARPPLNLAAGEYWARPVITTTQAVQGTSSSNQDVSTSINIIKRTFLSLKYRNGRVRTGVTIQNMTPRVKGDTLALAVDLKRIGNAAYLGYINIQILNASNEVQKQLHKQVAVYHQLNYIFQFDISNLPSGSYKIRTILDARSRRMKDDSVLKAPRASETTVFVIRK